jgi:predicted transposase/invertase (TIGR01784 family)
VSEYKYALDTQSKVVHAKREGRREEKLEIAKAMKDIGDPIEKIVRLTGLTEQQINEL